MRIFQTIWSYYIYIYIIIYNYIIYILYIYYISQTWFHNCSYWWIWASNPLFQETLFPQESWRMSDQQTSPAQWANRIFVYFFKYDIANMNVYFWLCVFLDIFIICVFFKYALRFPQHSYGRHRPFIDDKHDDWPTWNNQRMHTYFYITLW